MESENNEKTVMLREIGMQADFVHDNIDGMLGFATRDSQLPHEQQKLRPLLADSRAVERAYYEKTSIYPINHCVVIRNDVLEKHPGLTQAVQDAYARAKENAGVARGPSRTSSGAPVSTSRSMRSGARAASRTATRPPNE